MAVMNLLRKVKIENSWKLLPVKRIGDRYDFTAVLNGGVQTVVTAGTFYLEWREAGERKRRAVGTHPREAKAAIADQARVVALRESGMEIPDAPQIQARRQHAGPSIADVIARFNEIAPMKYAAKSRAKYLNALRDFQRWCNARQKTHVEQIGRHEVIDFMGHVVAKDGLDNSTALDKGRVVHAVFNQQGADIRMKRGDWPRVTETEVEVYEPAVLEKLFAAATVDEYVLFQTFMLTGFREQEIGSSPGTTSSQHGALCLSRRSASSASCRRTGKNEQCRFRSAWSKCSSSIGRLTRRERIWSFQPPRRRRTGGMRVASAIVTCSTGSRSWL